MCDCEKKIDRLINDIIMDRPTGDILISSDFPISLSICKKGHYYFEVKRIMGYYYYKMEVEPLATSNINLYLIIRVFKDHNNC